MRQCLPLNYVRPRQNFRKNNVALCNATSNVNILEDRPEVSLLHNSFQCNMYAWRIEPQLVWSVCTVWWHICKGNVLQQRGRIYFRKLMSHRQMLHLHIIICAIFLSSPCAPLLWVRSLFEQNACTRNFQLSLPGLCQLSVSAVT